MKSCPRCGKTGVDIHTCSPKTPRTDAQCKEYARRDNNVKCVDIDFARQLEQELNELKETQKQMILDAFPVTEERVKWEQLIQERDTLKRERDEAKAELQRWKDLSDSVHDNWQKDKAERDQLRLDVETLEIRAAAMAMHTQSVVDENTQLRKVVSAQNTNLISADAELDQLRKVADELATSEKCPNCEDVGWFTEWRRTIGGDPEPEQRQCEFCETNPKSKFKALELYSNLPHVKQKETK